MKTFSNRYINTDYVIKGNYQQDNKLSNIPARTKFKGEKLILNN